MTMPASNDIAIVGFAYKLPEDIVDDLAFWEILQGARNLSSKWPENRMTPDAHPDARKGTTDNCCGGHFIQQDLASFDAPFFGITAKEAAYMDPVQRSTLEVSYRAFENAGILSESLKGSRTAVLSATWTEDFIRMASMDPDNFDRTAATGLMASVIPNRVSYFFGLQGPSMHVDTACSSALSAFDLACKLLASGDADAALVTSANLILEPGIYQMLRNLQMISPDSTSKSFDSKANGFARGEGVLSFVLKPVSAAIQDGDMIRAVVRGVASNQDGRTPALSQPNPIAQEKLIRFVYSQAGLGMEQTRYVEAHGTGTPVGDPIEMKAIGKAFRDTRSAEEPLYVGSIKSNIGHLEGASGLAGVLKSIRKSGSGVLLPLVRLTSDSSTVILEKGVIPPNALFNELNPTIDAKFLRVEVPSQCIPWPSLGTRRVSINSFGFGGSNTHVILEDALHFLEYRGLRGHHCTSAVPAAGMKLSSSDMVLTNGSGRSNGTAVASPLSNGTAPRNGTLATNGTAKLNGTAKTNGTAKANGTAETNGTAYETGSLTSNKEIASLPRYHRLLAFSAFDERATQRTLEGYTSWYKANDVSSDHDKLDALAYTLSERRDHMRWRSFAIASAFEGEEPGVKQTGLNPFIPNKPTRVASEPGLCWVFTGQGAQYVDMGWELIGMYSVFDKTLGKVDEVYAGFGCDWSIFDELRQERNIHKPEYSQPLVTAIQIALVELLRSFGITPKVVIGHSSGEIAAAYAVGALSLTSACKASYFRGRVAGQLRTASVSSPGAMIAINLAPDEVPNFLLKTQAQGTEGVGIACINSPLNVTLSGPEPGIDAIKAHADQEGIFAQKLKTGVAYHSQAMRSVATEYLSLMGSLEPAEALPIPMISTVTGKPIEPSELATGQYWTENMISPVKFASAVKLVASKTMNLGITDWVEVGPHPALRRYIQDTMGKEKIHYSTGLQRNHSATQKTLELAGTLFCRGHSVSLTTVNNQQAKRNDPFLINCPPYPFDDSNKFWAESRISRDYRLRTPTKGGLLGQRVTDWNPLQPRWRSFLSVETHPWIGHHVIADAVLYPAAAMLISSFEAVQEMVPTDKTVVGHLVEEAQFLNPVIVPDKFDDRIEIIVSLQPAKNRLRGNEMSSNWFDINMFTYTEEGQNWTEVFRASVQAQYASIAGDLERNRVDEVIREQHRQVLAACELPVDARVMYSDAFNHGLQYGKLFQLCEDIKWDKTGARAVATIPALSNEKYGTASLVHPAILDTMFHALRVSAGQQNAANVPSRLTDAWFASAGWQSPDTGSFRWMASFEGKRDGVARGEKGSVSALGDDGKVLARIGKLVTAAISREDSGSSAESEDANKKTLLYGIEWKPQLSLLSAPQLAEVCKADIFADDEETTLADHRKRTAVLTTAAVRHVRNVPKEQFAKLDSTLRHHMDWMEHFVNSLSPEERQAAEALTEAEYSAQLDSFTAAFPTWELYERVARAFPAIIAGEVDALQIIFESEHAKVFYASLFQPICGDGRLGRFLDLAAHEKPSQRILEVGAGTGGVTGHIMNALREREKRTGTTAFAEYMYTDITPVFFESARARWESEGLGDRLLFKVLDMEHPVSGQGFTENAYDMVVAGSCVHATKLLSKTLQNLRRLLKPGGKLVLLEPTNPTDLETSFFSTLAGGWWLSEEEERIQNRGPIVSDRTWNELLKQNGFSGNELVLKDTPVEEAHIVSIIVSTALDETKGKKPESDPRRIFIVDPQQKSQSTLARVLSTDQDTVIPLDKLSDASIRNDDIVTSLLEVDNPFLSSMSETQFSQLQTLFKHSRSLLWVTAPRDGMDDARFPHYAVAQGFLRTVRGEMPESHIVSLSIEDVSGGETREAIINRTSKAAFGATPSPELEYIFRSSQLHTARAVENKSANTTLRSLLYPRLQELIWKDSPAVKLALSTPGSIESLRFEQDKQYDEALAAHDIEIEARAWGLSRTDVLAALGRDDDDLDGDNFGTDCSGVVTRVGEHCDPQGPKPGDSVVMLARGCMRKFPRAHETSVLKIPSQSNAMSFEVATATLEPALTAYRTVVDVARVNRNDKVLVHEAASARGQMVVQIAKMEGAEVFVTTGSSSSREEEAKEKELLVTTLGIAPEHIFPASHSTTSFAAGVRSITRGYGVDVVINTLANDQFQASWELLVPGGRLVDISLSDDVRLPRAGTPIRNRSLAVVNGLDLPPHVTARLLNDTVQLLDEGKIAPPTPVRVFPATEVKEAFRTLQNGEDPGRVVLVPRPDDAVPQLVFDPRAMQTCKFDENASYLIPGGLGGIGRSIIAWMAACGANNFIVPSRSGNSTPAAAKLISLLSSGGVHIATPKCDATNEAELATLLEDCQRTMPPIRGVINCAMVLPNAIFAQMSFQQWSLGLNTKVGVSFNVHRLLSDKENLDFCIHLSSLAGINGQLASSNYAAGCTFQDALSRSYPRTVSLDIGWMSDVGAIAEDVVFQRQLKDWDVMQRIEERELLGILRMVCGDNDITQQQFLIGIRTPADFVLRNQMPLPPLLDTPFLSTFARVTNPTKSADKKTVAVDYGALFRGASEDETRASVVTSALMEKLARATVMSANDVDPDRTLSAYGIDSLMAVDIRNWLTREFSAVLSVWEIMGEDRAIKRIAETVVRKSSVLKK
ncbi:polyketide synthase [Onygenales sp. PD_10]|nr:polyketide synthase [Onygenales sp. PD_10]